MKLLSALLLAFLIQAPPFEEDIKKFEASDAKNPPAKGGVVFVGSSSIRLWKTLKEDFPRYNVINRGFGGSQIADSVRYAHRIVTPYQPKMVVFFAGTNDVASGRSANELFSDYQAFVKKVREKLPTVPIAYISITPAPSRWDKVDVMRSANVQIETYAREGKNLVFVNVFKEFLTAEGKPRPELFVEDQLHMNEKGYAIWKKAVGPILP